MVGLAQPSSAAIIQDIISGCILLVITWAAKYLRTQAQEQQNLVHAFEVHTESNRKNFKALRKYTKDAQKTAAMAAKTALRAVTLIEAYHVREEYHGQEIAPWVQGSPRQDR